MKWIVVSPGEKKQWALLVSPMGKWAALWGKTGLFKLESALGGSFPEKGDGPAPAWLEKAWEQFWDGESFEARLCTEKKVPMTTAGVWDIVLGIPFGATLSYGEVAVRAGIPGGARAVGSIMRANPWALFLPCHRVIGKDGRMRGYGGPSGVGLKSGLIEFEKQLVAKKEGSL